MENFSKGSKLHGHFRGLKRNKTAINPLIKSKEHPKSSSVRRASLKSDYSSKKHKRSRKPMKSANSHTISVRKSLISSKKTPSLNHSLKLSSSKKTMEKKKNLSIYEQIEILDYPEVYYRGKKATKSMKDFDDADQFYKTTKGDHIAYRYEITKFMGKGSFAQVFRAFDHKNQKTIALKILKNDPNIFKQGQVEGEILKKFRNSKYIVRAYSSFVFRRHNCIAFEILSKNLYEVLKANEFNGLPLKVIKIVGIQIAEGLKQIHSQGIIHCDLKPENILLKKEGKANVKIIDFGSACFEKRKIFNYIQSRFYRAPEIALGISYDAGIDIWSFGCILFELCCGLPLFPAHSEQDLLSRIVKILGPPPIDLLAKSTISHVYFKENKLNAYRNSKNRTPTSKKLLHLIDDQDLSDLVSRCLIWDSNSRIKAHEMLNHPFFKY